MRLCRMPEADWTFLPASHIHLPETDSPIANSVCTLPVAQARRFAFCDRLDKDDGDCYWNSGSA